MIQRIQSVYLLLITALMAVLAILTYKEIWQCLLFVLLGIASLVAIFLYKNRKRQLWVVRILLLVLIIVLGYNFFTDWQVFNFHPDKITAIIGLVTAVSGILTVLALRAIYKDEKLVRSADRLR